MCPSLYQSADDGNHVNRDLAFWTLMSVRICSATMCDYYFYEICYRIDSEFTLNRLSDRKRVEHNVFWVVGGISHGFTHFSHFDFVLFDARFTCYVVKRCF